MPGPADTFATLWSPGRGLAAAVAGRRFAWPLVLATMAALGLTALALPRTDFAAQTEAELDREPDAAKMTPHEREEKIESARKVAVVGATAKALAWPAAGALLAAVALWLGFKVAGGAPTFAGTFAVVAHAQLPGMVRDLASIPGVLARPVLAPGEAATLLPSSLAALAPEGLAAPKLAVLASLDLFALWALLLVVLGMAHAAKVTRLRAAVAGVLLWASYVAVFRVALPAMGGGGA